ncbi:hypothetical protein GAO09_19340 [Rhizobiales bacterium RZME27]|uniref:Uncharacterized protein n=1 Tax=Endobacterium cereale TaxID=2663029 RepID=A0A6A8AA79_9HYPH|nr:hypothetical protein [Endobacterium cereale]MQY48193.1 hypothetical protein [Endobacterium cereale]
MSDKPAKTPKLGGNTRFQPSDFSIQRFAAKVSNDTTLEDILHPEFFSNHLDRMKPGMEITVLSDDFQLDARLRVLTVEKTTASLRVLDDYSGAKETNSKPEKEPKPAKGSGAKEAEGKGGEGSGTISGQLTGKVKAEDLEVTHGGPQGWRFKHGDKIVEQGFGSKADAEAARDKYLAKVNGEAAE